MTIAGRSKDRRARQVHRARQVQQVQQAPQVRKGRQVQQALQVRRGRLVRWARKVPRVLRDRRVRSALQELAAELPEPNRSHLRMRANEAVNEPLTKSHCLFRGIERYCVVLRPGCSKVIAGAANGNYQGVVRY